MRNDPADGGGATAIRARSRGADRMPALVITFCVTRGALLDAIVVAIRLSDGSGPPHPVVLVMSPQQLCLRVDHPGHSVYVQVAAAFADGEGAMLVSLRRLRRILRMERREPRISARAEGQLVLERPVVALGYVDSNYELDSPLCPDQPWAEADVVLDMSRLVAHPKRKRAVVEALLLDPRNASRSDQALAPVAGVTPQYIGQVRRRILSINNSSGFRIATRNGTTYQINTARIGKRR